MNEPLSRCNVTVIAPDRYAAAAVARAVVSDALRRQAPSLTQSGDCLPVIVRQLIAHHAPELLV